MGKFDLLQSNIANFHGKDLHPNLLKNLMKSLNPHEVAHIYLIVPQKVVSIAREVLIDLLMNQFLPEREEVLKYLSLKDREYPKRVKSLFLSMLHSNESYMKITALKYLSTLNLKTVDRILIKSSKSNFRKVQQLAIELMKHRKSLRIESALLRMLGSSDYVVRAWVIDSLSTFSSARVVRELLRVALYDEVTILQFSALNVALNHLGVIDFTDPLIKIISTVRSTEIRDLANGYLHSIKIRDDGSFNKTFQNTYSKMLSLAV